MSKRFRLITAIAVLVFAVILGLVGYFSWINIAYVDTLHARVDGSLIQVGSPGVGRVVALPVVVGDAVAENEELALVELAGMGTGQAQATRIVVPVRAPTAGVVVETAARVSDVVSPGQLIVTLVDPRQLWITANIHQARIPQIKLGQHVRVRVRTRTLRRTFWGKVEQIGGATSSALAARGKGLDISTPGLAEVPVKISIDSAGYSLYPGTSVEVRIRLSPRIW